LPRVILSVHDETKQPVPGAGAWLAPGEARWLARDDATLVGVTDADGRLALGLEQCGLGSSVIVGRHGYVTQAVVLATLEEHVVLKRGEAVDFKCVDRRGVPLGGVVVRASMRPMDIAEDWMLRAAAQPMGAPGLDPAHAIHVGVSDATGTARVQGLQPGEVAWEASAEGYMITEGPGLKPPDNERVTCPGRTYTLVFTPMYAIGLVTRGDELGDCRGHPSGNWVYSALGAYQTRRVTERLKALHPEWIVAVLGIADPDKPLVMNYELLFAERGPVQREIPFKPLGELLRDGPVVVDVSTLARSERCHAKDVMIRLINRDGTTIPSCRLALGNPAAPHKPVIMTSDERQRVPLGTYRVSTHLTAVNNSMIQPCEVVIDADSDVIDVPLTRELRRVRVTKTASSGRPPRGGVLVFEKDNGGKMSVVFGSASSIEDWLPLARFTVTLDCPGYRPTSATFDVVSGEDVQLELPLESTR